MKYKLVSLFALIILFAMLTSSCTKEENSVNPPSGIAILNTSFEKNGFFSAEGWTLPSNSDSSSDVPVNGGSYSLVLKSVSPPQVFAEIKVPVLSQYNNYILSFWSKSTGVSSGVYGKAILSLLRNGSTIDSVSIIVQDINWYDYTISDSFSVAAGDSFLVQLSGGTSELLPGKTYFDLCTLEAVE
jgi:hypothetical protein